MEAKKRKRSKVKEERVPLTAAMRRALDQERLRTGLTPYSFAVKQRKKLGAISYSKIETWLSGRAKTIYLSEYQQALAAWKELPDQVPRMRKSPELLALLRAERKRTNVSMEKLLADSTDLPDGLSLKQAKQFYNGVQRWFPRVHFEYLLHCWKALPDCPVLTITPDTAKQLQDHMDRTGKGPSAILRGASDRPEGVNAAMIRSWLRGRGKARKDHFDYVIRRYETAVDEVLVSPRTRQIVLRQIRRTGVNADRLLRDVGLVTVHDPVHWSQWPPSRVSEKSLQVMLAAWEALPDNISSRRSRQATELLSDQVEVTPEMASTIKEQIERTGKGPAAILRGAPARPERLNAKLMRKLLQVGTVVPREYWECALKIYQAEDDRIAVPQQVRDKIRRHIRRTGEGPNELLRKAEVIAVDDPRDWSKWPASREREADLVTMMALWESLPDKAGPHRKMASAMPRSRKQGHKKRLQSEELELRRHYLRFLSRVQRVLPLPEKHVVLLFEHLHGNDGQLPETIRDTHFAGLTSVEVQQIERAYMITLLEA